MRVWMSLLSPVELQASASWAEHHMQCDLLLLQLLRIFTTSGLQSAVITLPGAPVALAAEVRSCSCQCVHSLFWAAVVAEGECA
jgi:hypothetical protein